MRTRERIDGDAVIEIDDFSRPDVDVALTGIGDAGGRPRADLHWEDIPLSQGRFQTRDMAGSIEGRFYGSDHGEVGGIFERDRLMGAFGASRCLCSGTSSSIHEVVMPLREPRSRSTGHWSTVDRRRMLTPHSHAISTR